ncbi:TetR/AcrR family transcriptional regulator [Paracoccus sp. SCSIO 75233]|uniref:TetR/AcrR family transcriptional regulator n=1 Tax=Paracoccus sp. SCSIO 75233 TaxID=3017782 RepID=UPI00349FFFE3
MALRRRSYHHGNLREALIEAAIYLIEKTGPHSFSLSEAARRAGVSAAAPYRHFKGRDDLLEEVARLGFIEFGKALSKAYGEGGPTPLDAIQRVGSSYLKFAEEHQGYYMAMFESGIAITRNSTLYQVYEDAFSVLIKVTQELVDAAPPETRPPVSMIANHIWAMSHGVVELFARSKQSAITQFSASDILSSGVLIYLNGLGLLNGTSPERG